MSFILYPEGSNCLVTDEVAMVGKCLMVMRDWHTPAATPHANSKLTGNIEEVFSVNIRCNCKHTPPVFSDIGTPKISESSRNGVHVLPLSLPGDMKPCATITPPYAGMALRNSNQKPCWRGTNETF